LHFQAQKGNLQNLREAMPVLARSEDSDARGRATTAMPVYTSQEKNILLPSNKIR
jgi:hypothetical protein